MKQKEFNKEKIKAFWDTDKKCDVASNELKTLKDFKDINCYIDFETHIFEEGDPIQINKKRYLSEDSLKQEAIKWIKLMQYDEDYNNCLNNKFEQFKDSEFLMYHQVTNWIKYFFNITNEDLKC